MSNHSVRNVRVKTQPRGYRVFEELNYLELTRKCREAGRSSHTTSLPYQKVNMKIAVDGSVFQGAGTGIPKGTRCLYENATRLTRSLDVTVVHRGPLMCTFSPKIKSVQIGAAVPNHLWRALALPAYLAAQNRNLCILCICRGSRVSVSQITFGSKVIVTLHDVLPLTVSNYFASEQAELTYRKRVQTDLDRSDLVLTISKFSKKQILRNFNVDARLVVIYYAATVQKSRQTLDFS